MLEVHRVLADLENKEISISDNYLSAGILFVYMGWKDWPSWLKGGITGAIIGLILGLLGGIINSLYVIPIIIELFVLGSLFGFIVNTTWFKSKAYWLKGGIISALIILCMAILNTSLNYKGLSQDGGPLYDTMIALWIIVGIPIELLNPLNWIYTIILERHLLIPEWLSAIIMILLYFMIGALYGWLIGKRESKQNS